MGFYSSTGEELSLDTKSNLRPKVLTSLNNNSYVDKMGIAKY
jgi:hypothetical protein